MNNFAAISGALLVLTAAPACAQDRAISYPLKPVRIIAGSAPGGAVDFIGRLPAQKLTEALGQPFVVEQRTGASGSIAMETVAKSAPDGYTLASASMATLCVVPHLYVKIGYDPVLTSLPHVKAGKIRALAVGAAKRTPLLPDLPTVAESGLPGFEATSWFGLVAPAATPRDIIARLHTTLVKTIGERDVAQRLLSQGMEPVLNTPEQFADVIRQDLPRWAKVVRAAGIRAE